MNITISPSKLSGTIEAISSKSILHRAMICSALSEGPCIVETNTFSEDIMASIKALSSLGAKIEMLDNAVKISPIIPVYNRTVEVNCGESGSTLRFLLPVAAALGISSSFSGKGRLPERPMLHLKEALTEHGVSVKGDFPIYIDGKLKGGEYEIDGNVSSQFVSGLLFALPLCMSDSVLTVKEPVESQSYIDMTIEILKRYRVNIDKDGNTYRIPGDQLFFPTEIPSDGDWSNSAFWLAGGVHVTGLNTDSPQGDKKIIDVFKKFGLEVVNDNGEIYVKEGQATGADFDVSDIPDLVMIIAVIASTAKGSTKIYNAKRLRFKESDRLKSTTEMINNLGGSCKETDDGLIIDGKSQLDGGTINCYGDHRIAMASAIASCKCKNNVVLNGAKAVRKSYPSFFKHFENLGGVIDVM